MGGAWDRVWADLEQQAAGVEQRGGRAGVLLGLRIWDEVKKRVVLSGKLLKRKAVMREFKLVLPELQDRWRAMRS